MESHAAAPTGKCTISRVDSLTSARNASQRHRSNAVPRRRVGSQRSRQTALKHCGRRYLAAHATTTGSESEGLTYKAAGVDIDAGAELVNRIRKLNPDIGGFSGLYPFGDSYLVAGTDGVGTKLKLAFDMNKHDTIGIDLVAMSVNDIVTCGAKPMFFLDYFATSKLDVDMAEQVVKGIVEGCNQSGCALLGGETAEMPDFYKEGEYDLSGFAVGSVLQKDLINGENIVAGDKLVGLASTGVHSNGFSLVRRVLDRSGSSLQDSLPGDTRTIGEAMLAPTKIYVNDVLTVMDAVTLKGCCHITGGGFLENLPRIFPDGLGCSLDAAAWDVPPIFQWVQKQGGIADVEMMRTFNMGVGMVLVVSAEDADKAIAAVGGSIIGEIVEGEGVSITAKNGEPIC
mmetsp:Transcript_6919/g.25488  ORF Transcript_6919/g.25488 Transcript_6919/m.25488 type:complete len:399 (+) Transcript_6919:59-1255(+)